MAQADILLKNGKIWTGRQRGTVEALAIQGDRVMAAGALSDMETITGPQTNVVDLGGRTATPGLDDNHLHLLPFGLALTEVDVRPDVTPTIDAMLTAIRDRAGRTPPGGWVVGRGYDQFQLAEGRHPTRSELDTIAPDHPVIITRTCGHVSVVNSRAMQLAGVDDGVTEIPGGYIERENDRWTGMIAERAREPFYKVLPKLTRADLVEAIDRAGQVCLSYGITSVMEAAMGNRAGLDEWYAYEDAKATLRLPVRTYICLHGGSASTFNSAYDAGIRSGQGDAMLKVGAVKIFTDGSAGGKTAAMFEAYLGSEQTKGVFCLSDEEMIAHTVDHHAKGFQLAVHAIGDAAIEQTLMALAEAEKHSPVKGRRHRIEHAGFATPNQLQRMLDWGMSTGTQPVFLYDFGDLYHAVLGAERSDASYPMKTWMDRGLHPVASTDCPVCDINPFRNLYAMLTRKSKRGTVLGADQVLIIEEALAAYTENGAWASFWEADKGDLAPGKLADVAIWSRDLLTAEPEAILEDTRCDMTIRGGEVVFDRAG